MRWHLGIKLNVIVVLSLWQCRSGCITGPDIWIPCEPLDQRKQTTNQIKALTILLFTDVLNTFITSSFPPLNASLAIAILVLIFVSQNSIIIIYILIDYPWLPFSTLLYACGPENAMSLFGTIQLRSPFSILCKANKNINIKNIKASRSLLNWIID